MKNIELDNDNLHASNEFVRNYDSEDNMNEISSENNFVIDDTIMVKNKYIDNVLQCKNDNKLVSIDSGIELVGKQTSHENLTTEHTTTINEPLRKNTQIKSDNKNISTTKTTSVSIKTEFVTKNNSVDTVVCGTDKTQETQTQKLTDDELCLVNRSQSPQKVTRVPNVTISEDDVCLPKIINRNDGLKNSIYYFDENGSPKIRDEVQMHKNHKKSTNERKRNSFAAREKSDDDMCTCFSFSKLKKKLKEIRK